jgi:hypothetical protein
VQYLEWGREYKTLTDRCGLCKRDSQYEDTSCQADESDYPNDGDAMDEDFESDDMEISIQSDIGEAISEGLLNDEDKGEEREGENDKDVDGDVAMSDDDDEEEDWTDEQLEKMMSNVFIMAAEFPYRNGPSFVLQEGSIDPA